MDAGTRVAFGSWVEGSRGGGGALTPAALHTHSACSTAPSTRTHLHTLANHRVIITTLQVPLTAEERSEREAAAAANKPNKLALGTEGGFSVDAQRDYTIEKTASLVVLQGGRDSTRLTVALPCPELPELVLTAITALQVGLVVGVDCGQPVPAFCVCMWGRVHNRMQVG